MTINLELPLPSYTISTGSSDVNRHTQDVDKYDLCYKSMFEGCHYASSTDDCLPPLPTYPYDISINTSGYVDSSTDAGRDAIRKRNINNWKSICHILKHR